MIDRRPIIGVMGSHESEWSEYSIPVGRLIAEHDYHLLTGAGAGVMSAVSQAFVDVENREGVNIGIIPTVDYDGTYVPRKEYPNPYIEIPILTPLDVKAQKAAQPYSRNFVNVMTSHAMVILPGDHGTRDEVSLGIQYKKPMILFGPEDAFERFPDQTTRTTEIDEVREFLEKVTAKIRMDSENE